MNRVMLCLSTLALATLVGASAASAQVASPIKFGIGGGLSLPSGDVSDGFDNGFHGQVMVAFKAPVLPVSLRADVVYHTFGASDGSDVNLKVLGGGVNVVYDLPGIALRPFLSGGLGMYNVKVDASDPSFDADDTKLGFNAGAGLKFNLGGFNTFVETRYYSVQTEGSAATFIPVTFGIMF